MLATLAALLGGEQGSKCQACTDAGVACTHFICPVCLDPVTMDGGQTIADPRPVCNHIVHAGCLPKDYESNSRLLRCATCRSPSGYCIYDPRTPAEVHFRGRFEYHEREEKKAATADAANNRSHSHQEIVNHMLGMARLYVDPPGGARVINTGESGPLFLMD